MKHRWEKVKVHGRFSGNSTCRYPARPPGDHGYPVSTLVAFTLASPKPSRASVEPGAVVAGEDDKGVPVKAVSFEAVHYLFYAKVYFCHRVAVWSPLCLIYEVF